MKKLIKTWKNAKLACYHWTLPQMVILVWSLLFNIVLLQYAKGNNAGMLTVGILYALTLTGWMTIVNNTPKVSKRSLGTKAERTMAILVIVFSPFLLIIQYGKAIIHNQCEL